jgi:hypothetical protein
MRRDDDGRLNMPRKRTPDSSKPLSVEQARGKIAKAVRDLAAGHDPGPVTFRLKRTKKDNETYPLRLTQQQRASMIHATRIKNKVKERLQQAGEGTQIVGFTLKELDHLSDELGQAALYAPGPDKKRLVAILRKGVDLLTEEHAGVFEGVTPTTRKTAPKTGDLINQFRITLLDIKPAIWRRIQIPDCTLANLTRTSRGRSAGGIVTCTSSTSMARATVPRPRTAWTSARR